MSVWSVKVAEVGWRWGWSAKSARLVGGMGGEGWEGGGAGGNVARGVVVEQDEDEGM